MKGVQSWKIRGSQKEVIDKKLPGTERVASEHTARFRKAVEGKKVTG